MPKQKALDNLDELVEQGIKSAKEENWMESLALFKKVLALSPEDSNTHYYLGNILAKLGKPSEALMHLKQAIYYDDGHIYAHNNLGRLFYQLKDFKQAGFHYEKALGYQPYYSEAALNQALLSVAEAKYHLAKQQFDAILTWNTNIPLVYEQLAQLALRENHITLAKQYYLKRKAFPIDDGDTWNNIGAVLSQLKEYESAVHAFTEALKIDARHIHARNNRAAVYLEQRVLKEAIWDYMLSLRICHTDPMVHYNLGVALMLSGRLQKAINAFKAVIDLHDQHLDAWCNLGAIYIRKKDLKAAYKAYHQVITIQRDHEIGQFMLNALQQSRHLQPTQKQIISIPKMAPISYIKNLFNNYSNYFDTHLLNTLQYRIPQQMHALVMSYLKDKCDVLLDLGCGTGLAGEVFQTAAQRLVGIDIAENMLAEAEKKAIYHQLVADDLVHFLTTSDQSYDFILAADTLVYFGELTQVLQGVFNVASSGAYFIFSVELAEKRSTFEASAKTYCLTPTGRYQHRLDGIKKIAERCQWQWVTDRTVKGRLHHGEPVYAALCLLKK